MNGWDLLWNIHLHCWKICHCGWFNYKANQPIDRQDLGAGRKSAGKKRVESRGDAMSCRGSSMDNAE